MWTIYVELVALKQEVGGYIIYVFKNLRDSTYEMCTRLPNWECPLLKVGDVGYLKFKEVEAGKTTWYNKHTDKHIFYKYTGSYFLDFVYKPKQIDLIL